MLRIIAVSLCVAAVIGLSHQGNKTLVREDKVVVCYWGTWSHYRRGNGQFQVQDIDPFLCTHLIYAFSGLQNGVITSLDNWLDLGNKSIPGLRNFEKTVELKKVNPNLKVTLAIGGWTQGSQKYSDMARDAKSRKVFVKSVVVFLKQFGFDGLDFDWEYPGQRGGKPYDKENFVLLLKDLREAFKAEPNDYILTAAIAAAPEKINISYDIPKIYEYLDMVHVMCYDYHGPWDRKTGHNSPLYPKPNASGIDLEFTVSNTWKYLEKAGALPEKTAIGVPFYGHTYTLTNPDNHGLGAPATPGVPGPYTYQAGFMGYNEICEELTGPHKNDWTIVNDEDIKAPYMYNVEKWVCYDDPKSIKEKVNFIVDKNLAGVMIWSIETDDFKAACGDKFPLLNTINTILFG